MPFQTGTTGLMVAVASSAVCDSGNDEARRRVRHDFGASTDRGEACCVRIKEEADSKVVYS